MTTDRRLAAAALLLVLVTLPTPAVAYESEITSAPVGLPCTVCHGASGVATGTVDASRKGPHGGYTTGTAKCESCHYSHGAPVGVNLLPAQTVRATCLMCHDGTGGNGVYGTIRARTGSEPESAHRIDVTNVIPAGSADGDEQMEFRGVQGRMTCSDCHSPHDDDTIDAFVGDRLRVADEGSVGTPTNRLLRRRPGDSTATVDAYGSDWCAACHQGALADLQAPGLMGNHSAATDADGLSYSRIVRLTSTDTTSTEYGSLGGSNLGYLMPDPRSPLQDGKSPICQQCHEDARHVGDELAEQFTLQPEEAFSVTLPDGRETSDTPRFQVFPHEGLNPGFRIESGDDLCLNCHPA